MTLLARSAASSSTSSASTAASVPSTRRSSLVPEKKYKCQFCHTAFSRSEHRSRHERSHTKERPFKCLKCRSTFVRRDLLLRHDRTVHAKDGGVPLHGDTKRRATGKNSPTPAPVPSKPSITIDHATLEQIEASSDGVVDLETAALLMTDLHHKATAAAAAASSTPSPYSSRPEIAQANPTAAAGDLLDSGLSFTAPVTLPPVQWESFMSAMVDDSKPRSISSSVSGSQDSQTSLTSVSTAQPSLLDPPSPVMARIKPSDAGSLLAPTSTPNGPDGACATPAASPASYSPHPYIVAPPSPQPPSPPQVYSRSPTPVGQVATLRAPCLANDAERTAVLDAIREEDPEDALAGTFRLPGLSSLNRYLSTYFNLFHHHLPFLHPASFQPVEVSPALLLAVLSIGALYSFEHAQAYMFHIGSKMLVSQFLQNKENFSSRKCPLWTMQSSLLNMIFASWSGDPKGLEWACSIKGLLSNMVSGNRYELKLRTEAREGAEPSYAEWVEDEGCRRTYFAAYIFFGLLTMTYNQTSAISFNEIDSLELPSSETVWSMELADEEAWREQRRAASGIRFREAHDKLFQGEPAQYSALATRVMINALFLEVWYHKRSPEALQDVVTEYKLRRALETWEQALDLCEPESVTISLAAPHKGHPLIFNALAMFRHTRARLEVDLRTVQEALRYHDPYEVAAAMTLARDQVKRSQTMTKVVRECVDCIEIAALQGVRWVARTAATNWSVEHPLCSVDLVVILSLWLWRVEHDDDEPASDEELDLYNKVRALFEDDDHRSATSGGSSGGDHGDLKLSGTVARVWGGMLDEVVVWGITRLLGESLKLHSQALVGYEEALPPASPVASAPSTPPPYHLHDQHDHHDSHSTHLHPRSAKHSNLYDRHPHPHHIHHHQQ